MECDTVNSKEITIKDILLIIFRYKVLLFIVTLISIGFSFFIAITAQPYYTSSSIFFTKIAGGDGVSQYAELASLAGINLGSSKSIDPSNYLDKVLQDEQFLTRVTNKKWYYNGDSVLLEKIWKLKPNTDLKNWEFRYAKGKNAFLRDGGYISFSKNIKSGLLTLTTTFEGPEIAYDVNCYILQFFQEYMGINRKSQAKDKCAFISERITEVKQNLEKSENALTSFKEKNFMSTAPRILTEEMRLVRQVTINQELYLQLQKQYEIARIEELNDQPLIQVVQNPEVPYKKSKPKRRNIVVMGFLLGIFAGCALAISWEWYTRNIRHV